MAQVAACYGAGPMIALGDARNGIEMFEAADVVVIVVNPTLSPFAGELEVRVLHTMLPGPEGWNATVLELVEGCQCVCKKG